jgi:hypothetical protein
MSRRQSGSDLAIDLGIARSTDYSAPPLSSRVSPKWRAPRPVTWPPPLPAHRVPGSAPRSAPPNRFHEPVLHAPLLTSYVAPRKSHAGLWLAWVFLIAAGGAGFVLRGRLAAEVTSGSAWLRSELPSDLAERPRIAWGRMQDLVAQGVSRARGLVPGLGATQTPPTARAGSAQANDNPAIAPTEPAKAPATVAEAPVIAVSALPLASPAPTVRSVPHAKPTLAREASASVAGEGSPITAEPAPTAAPVRAATPAPEPVPVQTASAPPAAPAPEPGSLDDLIRKTVERESHQKH